jgi:hypothetical protein
VFSDGGRMMASWEAAKWTWENRESILSQLGKIFKWFRGSKKAPGILVMGAGGTGKTTLAQLLSGNQPGLLGVPRDYEESIAIERLMLKDDKNVEIVIPPGQQHRRDATWADLESELVDGKYRGLILVSAYGYHSLGNISYKRHRLYRGNKKQFMQRYLRDRRNEEIAILQRLTPHIRRCPTRLWTLSLVTKEDLWWQRRLAAEGHYRGQRNGTYGGFLRELLHRPSPTTFRHEHVSCSLAINNFVTGRRELLKTTTEGYDQQMQRESLRRLVEAVAALMKWESDR